MFYSSLYSLPRAVTNIYGNRSLDLLKVLLFVKNRDYNWPQDVPTALEDAFCMSPDRLFLFQLIYLEEVSQLMSNEIFVLNRVLNGYAPKRSESKHLE